MFNTMSSSNVATTRYQIQNFQKTKKEILVFILLEDNKCNEEKQQLQWTAKKQNDNTFSKPVLVCFKLVKRLNLFILKQKLEHTFCCVDRKTGICVVI